MGLLIEKKVYGNTTTQGLYVGVSPEEARLYQNDVDAYKKLEEEGKATGPPKVFSITQKRPYMFYSNKNTFLREYSEERYKHSKYAKWTETSHFEND